MNKIDRAELMEDSIFKAIRDIPFYEKNGLCNDCVNDDDMNLKPVRRVDGDGLNFCEKHWKNVVASFYGTGEFYEPFPIQ